MLAFNPRDPAFIANPYPAYRALRETMPVWRSPFGRTFLARYEDSALLLRDRRLGKDSADPETLIRRFGPTALQESAVVELSNMMLMKDPPDHTRLRGLVTKVFTARRIEDLRPGIQAITDRLLDKVQSTGEMDAIRDLAFPLPMLVICELLGIPEEDRAEFVTRTASGGALLNPVPPTRARWQAAHTSKRCSSSAGRSRATIC
jgi:cytochrome P450